MQLRDEQKLFSLENEEEEKKEVEQMLALNNDQASSGSEQESEQASAFFGGESGLIQNNPQVLGEKQEVQNKPRTREDRAAVDLN